MKGWRTVLFNVASLAAMAGSTEFVGAFPPAWLPYIAVGAGIGNLLLRFLTTTPIGEKQ